MLRRLPRVGEMAVPRLSRARGARLLREPVTAHVIVTRVMQFGIVEPTLKLTLLLRVKLRQVIIFVCCERVRRIALEQRFTFRSALGCDAPICQPPPELFERHALLVAKWRCACGCAGGGETRHSALLRCGCWGESRTLLIRCRRLHIGRLIAARHQAEIAITRSEEHT